MNSLKVTVIAELDGVPLAGFPVVRRLAVDEVQGFTHELAGPSGGYVALPADQLATIQALVLRADQLVTLRVDGQSDQGIRINPGGLVVLLDVLINAGAGAPNAKVDNSGTAVALLAGLAAGT
jgi:hypothetical protein